MNATRLASLFDSRGRCFFRKSSAVATGCLLLTLVLLAAPDVSAQTSAQTNVARGKPASQSSTAYGGDASRAVDGNTNGNYGANSVTHTNSGAREYWQVDLRGPYTITQIVIHHRTDCCTDRLPGATLQIIRDGVVVWSSPISTTGPISTFQVPPQVGNMVRVTNRSNSTLELAEVIVMGAPPGRPGPVPGSPQTQPREYNPALDGPLGLKFIGVSDCPAAPEYLVRVYELRGATWQATACKICGNTPYRKYLHENSAQFKQVRHEQDWVQSYNTAVTQKRAGYSMTEPHTCD